MREHESLFWGKRHGDYHRPAILHKGRLTQFAGSPLGRPGWNPLNLPKK